MITLERLHKAIARIPTPHALYALDPGETTGWAYFHGLKLVECGQLNTSDLVRGASLIEEHILDRSIRPTVVIMEDYRVYSYKRDSHVNNALHTPRLIGAVEVVVGTLDPPIPCRKQMASLAKPFITDEKLKAWGMYSRGQRHARDAIRHGLYYMLCSKSVAGSVIKYT
jgi:hypothetical protein